MRNVFDKAERWRQRAAELRVVADRMSEHSARSAVMAIAAALEEHARKIEEMALKIGHVQRVSRIDCRAAARTIQANSRRGAYAAGD